MGVENAVMSQSTGGDPREISRQEADMCSNPGMSLVVSSPSMNQD